MLNAFEVTLTVLHKGQVRTFSKTGYEEEGKNDVIQAKNEIDIAFDDYMRYGKYVNSEDNLNG